MQRSNRWAWELVAARSRRRCRCQPVSPKLHPWGLAIVNTPDCWKPPPIMCSICADDLGMVCRVCCACRILFRAHPSPLLAQAGPPLPPACCVCCFAAPAMQLELGNQILAEEKHLPLYKVGRRHAALASRPRALALACTASRLWLGERCRAGGFGVVQHPTGRQLAAPQPRQHLTPDVPLRCSGALPRQELEERFQVEYIAGGATQNSIRVAQWMLQVGAAARAQHTPRAPCLARRIGFHAVLPADADVRCGATGPGRRWRAVARAPRWSSTRTAPA